MERGRSWDAWTADVAFLTDSWNGAAAHVRAFNDAASDPTLAAIDGFNLDPNAGNVHQVANKQRVGGANPTAIGDLFKNVQVGTARISVGEEVLVDAGTKQGFGAAAGKVEDEKAAVNDTANKLKEALHGIKKALFGVTEKSHLRDAAREKVELRKDEKKADEQKETLESLKSAKEADVKAVKDLVKVADLVMKAAEKGAAEAATGAIEFALEKVIDAQYEDQLKAAAAALKETTQKISDHKDAIAISEFKAAQAALQGALAEYERAKAAVKTALDARKEAFRKLSEKAASVSGQDKATQDRMRAILQAIPVAERVVARIRTVDTALVTPRYTDVSGVGFHMARHANDRSAAEFLLYLGMLKGGQIDFRDRLNHWTARLTSLRKVYNEL